MIDEAVFHSRKSLEQLRRFEESNELEGVSLAARGWHVYTLLERAEWNEADMVVRESLEIVDALSDSLRVRPMHNTWKARVHLAAAAVRSGQNSAEEAIGHVEQCMTILADSATDSPKSVFSARDLSRAHLLLSDSYALQQDWARVEHHARESIRNAEAIGLSLDLNEAAVARFRLGQILAATNRGPEAKREIQLAIDRMSESVKRLPGEFYYIRRLLMLLTLSPSPEVGDVELAVTLADHESLPESQILSRYRALAYSSAGEHEKAMDAPEVSLFGHLVAMRLTH